MHNDQYRNIFVEIYEPIRDSDGLHLKYQYTNPSRLQLISVNGNEFIENVFTCLVIRGSRTLGFTIKQYYVSHNHYNMNEVPEKHYIFGRFVFSYDAENKIVVRALAEEYANLLTLTQSQVENHYKSKHGVPGKYSLM